jgi:hypothetical protein
LTYQKASHDQNNQSVVTKEIIKEKEVVTRVRCPYCHGAYNEILDKCPHCGAKMRKSGLSLYSVGAGKVIMQRLGRNNLLDES